MDRVIPPLATALLEHYRGALCRDIPQMAVATDVSANKHPTRRRAPHEIKLMQI